MGCVFESNPTPATASASNADPVVSPRRRQAQERATRSSAPILPMVRSIAEPEAELSFGGAKPSGDTSRLRVPGGDDDEIEPALSASSSRHTLHDMTAGDTPRVAGRINRTSSIVARYSALNENGSSEEGEEDASSAARPAVSFAIGEGDTPRAGAQRDRVESHQLSSDESPRSPHGAHEEQRTRSTSIQMRYDALDLSAGTSTAEAGENSGSQSPSRRPLTPRGAAGPMCHALTGNGVQPSHGDRSPGKVRYAALDADEKGAGADDVTTMAHATSLDASYASLDASRHNLADGDSPANNRQRKSSLAAAYEALDDSDDEEVISKRGRQGSTTEDHLGQLVADLGNMKQFSSSAGPSPRDDAGSLSPTGSQSPGSPSGRGRRRFHTMGHGRYGEDEVDGFGEDGGEQLPKSNRKKGRAKTAPSLVVAKVPRDAKEESRRESCEVEKGHTLRLAGAVAQVEDDQEALAA